MISSIPISEPLNNDESLLFDVELVGVKKKLGGLFRIVSECAGIDSDAAYTLTDNLPCIISNEIPLEKAKIIQNGMQLQLLKTL